MEWNVFIMQEYDREVKALTEREVSEVMPRIRGILSKRVGEGAKINGKDIVSLLQGDGMKVNEAKVRQVIRLLRISGQVKYLCGGNRGYYVAKSQGELTRYLQSNLRPRTRKVYTLWKSMEAQLDEMKGVVKSDQGMVEVAELMEGK